MFCTFRYHYLDTTIQTKYGLTLVRTGDNDSKKVDEMHILMPGSDASITSLYGAENMKKLKSNLRPYQKTQPLSFIADAAHLPNALTSSLLS